MIYRLERKGNLENKVSKAGRQYLMLEATLALKDVQNKTLYEHNFFGEQARFLDDTSVGTELVLEGYPYTRESVWEGKTYKNREFKVTKLEVARSEAENHAEQYQKATTVPDDSDGEPLPF